MNENSPLIKVMKFFGMSVNQFKTEWTAGGLTETDKKQIVAGVNDGSLTY